MHLPKTNEGFGWPFTMLIVLLFFDYVRPQSWMFSALSSLHLPMLMIIFLTYKGLADRKWQFQDIETKAFIAFVSLCVIYVPFAVNGYWAYETARAMVIYFLIYMAVLSFVDSLAKMRLFLNLWLVIGVFCAIRGILSGGKIPGSGFLGDENDFALYLTMMLPIAYVNLISSQSAKVRVYNLVMIIVLCSGVVASFSRGGFVGLIGILLYGFLITPRKGLMIVIVAIIMFTASPYVPPEYKQEISTIFEGSKESTASERIYLWTIALEMFYANPVVGVGPGNYPWRVAEYEPVNRQRDRGHGGRPAHSLYFTLLPELGLAGSLCFLTMILAPFRKLSHLFKGAVQSRSHDKPVVNGGDPRMSYACKSIYGVLFGFLFSGLFLSVLYYPHFWLTCALLATMSRLSDDKLPATQ